MERLTYKLGQTMLLAVDLDIPEEQPSEGAFHVEATFHLITASGERCNMYAGATTAITIDGPSGPRIALNRTVPANQLGGYAYWEDSSGSSVIAFRRVEYDIERGHADRTASLTFYANFTGRNKDTSNNREDNASSAITTGWQTLTFDIAAKPSYTISFDANGGDGTVPPDATKWWGEALAIPECVMGRDGYLFRGWSTSQDGGVDFEDAVSADFNSDATLYAVWDGGSYIVHFDGNGNNATCDLPDEEFVRGMDYYLPASVDDGEVRVAKAGFEFMGWATSPDGGPVYQDGEVVTDIAPLGSSSVTLYAVWHREKPVILSVEADRVGGSPGIVRLRFDSDTNISSSGVIKSYSITVWATPIGGGGSIRYRYSVSKGDSTKEIVLRMRGGGVLPDVGDVNYANPNANDRDSLARDKAYELKVQVADFYASEYPDLVAVAYTVMGSGIYTVDFAPGGAGIGVLMPVPTDNNGIPRDGLFINAIDGVSFSNGAEGAEQSDVLTVDADGNLNCNGIVASGLNAPHTHSGADITDGSIGLAKLDSGLRDSISQNVKLGSGITEAKAMHGSAWGFVLDSGSEKVGLYFNNNNIYLYNHTTDTTVWVNDAGVRTAWTYLTNNHFRYCKVGKVGFLMIYEYSSSSSAYVNVGTLPEGFRPPSTLYLAVVSLNGNGARLAISDAGAVSIHTYGKSDYHYDVVSFPLA